TGSRWNVGLLELRRAAGDRVRSEPFEHDSAESRRCGCLGPRRVGAPPVDCLVRPAPWRGMASLTFPGAAGTVTGSRHLLTTASGKRVLIDAGLFQGRRELRDRNWAPWTGGSLDAVVLTHAHIDHTGYLPRLVSQRVVRRVVCTEGTRDVAALLLPDSAHLQEEDARLANERGHSKHHPALPSSTAAAAQAAAAMLEAVSFEREVDVVPGVSVIFRRAGHIVGSAFLEARVDGKRIVFSGDLGRYKTPL